jgi:hypothetical protein
MEITLTDLPDSEPGKHPLLSSPQYAAQLAGGSVFFQVMSGLTENPVRVILHDKFSGKRKLLLIEAARELNPLLRSIDPSVIKEVQMPRPSEMAPPAPTAPLKAKAVPTPSPAKTTSPAPKAVASGASLKPAPAAPKNEVKSPVPAPKVAVLTVADKPKSPSLSPKLSPGVIKK